MEKEETDDKIVIAICGDPQSGKTVVSSYLRCFLPIKDRQYIDATVDGNGVIGDTSNQGLLNMIIRNIKLDSNLAKKVNMIIQTTESKIVIVDIGGLTTLENAQILSCCDYCILVNKTQRGHENWRKYIQSLRPGHQVEFIERVGVPLSEDEGKIDDDGSKVIRKKGMVYSIEDDHLSRPYDEIAVGHKTPKIILEVDSIRTELKPDAHNQITEEDGIIKAKLVDLERGKSGRILSRILVGEKEPFRLINVRDVEEVKTAAMMYFKMLTAIYRERRHPLQVKNGRSGSPLKSYEQLQTIREVEQELQKLDDAIERVESPDADLNCDTNTYEDVAIETLKESIREKILSVREVYTYEDEAVGTVVDFDRICKTINHSDWLGEDSLRKLSVVFDILLDDMKDNDRAVLHGARLLAGLAMFTEAAKKKGFPSILMHSSQYDLNVESQRLPKSSEIENGVPINGIRYYIEKNDEHKTVLMQMHFDSSLTPADLKNIVLPEIPQDYKLYFGGIIPDWFIGSFTMSYDNKEKAIMKPDNTKPYVTYLSEDIKNIGMQESNPAGIDLKKFFDKIPPITRVFKERSDHRYLDT